MKKTLGINIVIQAERLQQESKQWLEELSDVLAEEDSIILEQSQITDEMLPFVTILKHTEIIEESSTNLVQCIKHINNDFLIIKPGIKLLSGGINTMKNDALQRLDIGTITPMFLADVNLKQPHQIWGLGELLYIKQPHKACVYICNRALLPLADSVCLSDFNFNKIEKLFSKIVMLGFKHILSDEVLALGVEPLITTENENIYKNLELQLKLHNGRRNLLYVVQADFRLDASNNIGGTQLHVKDLVFNSKEQYNVFVAARNQDFLQVTAYLPNDTLTFEFYIGFPPAYPEMHDCRQAKIYENLLQGFQINLVHVHHTYGMSMDIFEIAYELKVPIILTLHDFYYICPTIKMFDCNNNCCIGKDCSNNCKNCLSKSLNMDSSISYINFWRQHNEEILKICDHLVVPSKNAKKVVSAYFPSIEDNIQVIEHGYDAIYSKYDIRIDEILVNENFKSNIEKIDENTELCTSVEGWACLFEQDNSASRILLEVIDLSGKREYIPTHKNQRDDVAQGNRCYLKSGFIAHIPQQLFLSGELQIRPVISLNGKFYSKDEYKTVQYKTKKNPSFNVAFIGGLSVAKGSKEIYKIITQDLSGVNWFIFGGIDDAQLAGLKRKNLVKTNFYQRDELQIYLDLHKIDVICILSLWPETFCYTLSEALAYHRPVIVTDIGALGDRTKNLECGWVVSLNNIAFNVLEIIDRIKGKETEFQERKNIVTALKLKSLEEMNSEYSILYEKSICDMDRTPDYNEPALFSAWLRTTLKKNPLHQNANISIQECQDYITQLTMEAQSLKNSKSFKLAQLISRIWNKIKFFKK